MKKIYFAAVLMITASINAQVVTLFEDSFEAYDDFSIGGITLPDGTPSGSNKGMIEEWTVVDIDGSEVYGFNLGSGIIFVHMGLPQAFMVMNPGATTPNKLSEIQGSNNDWKARTGEKNMTSFGSVNAPSNNFLISPKVTLGISDNILKFYAKVGDSQDKNAKFKVLISTTDTELNSFTEIASEIVASGNVYALYSYDLSGYNGKPIYVAINCNSEQQFGFILDDFSISGNKGLATSDTNIKNVTKVYPNPVSNTFKIDLGISIKKDKVAVEIFDISGKKLKDFKNSEEYNISDLTKGTYIVKINDGETKIVKKIIKN